MNEIYILANQTESLPALSPRTPVQPADGLGLADLDGSVQQYFQLGLAQSSRRTYKAAMDQFHVMCVQHDIRDPFPVSE